MINTYRFSWLALTLGAGLLATPRHECAAAAPSEVQTATVEFRGGAGSIKGYLARPQGKGPFPAIVVVHEWWGLSDWIKQDAARLASHGYVALAVDLYNGKVAKDPGEAHELMRALDPSEGVADLKGGAAYLKTLNFVKQDQKMGTIGWCMGGMYSRLLAQASDAIGPTVICYGSVSTEDDQIAKLQGKPVLGLFGATDRGIPAAKVEQFGKLLKGKGSSVDIHIFEGAGHGFMRPEGMQYNAKAATEAWDLIDHFFAVQLKP